MCISFLFINNNPDEPVSSKYKLILINNRDEYFARETQNASILDHENRKSIYAVDLAGAVNGTWLGISKDNFGNIKVGNLANVTGNDETDNVPAGKPLPHRRGRGPIVCDWINSSSEELSVNQHAQDLYENAQEFNNFNFISAYVGKSNKVESYYISNSPKSMERLTQNFIGLGNSPLSSPFEKVRGGTEKFEEIVRKSDNLSKEHMIESFSSLLKSEEKYFPDEELINRKKAENVDPERFSSIKIELKELGYGTRTHTIILVDKNNNIDYIEETAHIDPELEWITTELQL